MAVKPMLGDLELQLVDEIESDEDRVLQDHPVPGLEGDFTTDLGRRGTTVTLTGAVAGEEVASGLKELRAKFLAAAPVAFAADIATATGVRNVLVEELGIRELAGRPELYEYAITLREFTAAPAVPREPPPVIPPPPIPPRVGTLEVEVVVNGMPDVDPGTIVVTVDGTQDDGAALNRTLTSHTANVWTEPGFPPGTYTARATLAGPPTRQGEITAVVRRGALTHVVIVINATVTTPVAATFVVHFHFDKAFVEPCMRGVLAQIADHAAAHPDQKLLVVGHTDLTGSNEYNQSLSERRARAVFAMLTSGSDPAAARAEWNELRRPRTGTAGLRDSWGRREQQWMLRDLGLFQGNIDTEKPLPEDVELTRKAVRQFQSDHDMFPSGTVDDATWTALIDAYLSVRPLSLPTAQLLPNAGDGCTGGPLKWLGCGEVDPVDDTQDAERRNRRVELLFVTADHLPSDVKQPDTLNQPGAVWCLNPSNTTTRACFVRLRNPAKETCTTPDAQRFSRVPAEPGDVLVRGSIRFEDGTPLANTPFVLTAPSGKIMTGEHRAGALRGWAIAQRTDANGEFSFTAPQGIGVYTIEVRARVVARLAGTPLSSVRGNVVCARLQDPQSVLDIIVTDLAAAGFIPTLTAPTAVVVAKPGCNPRRQPVELSVNTAFTGTGTFTRSTDAVRFFDAAVGGTELTFDGTDNVFTGDALAAGVTLFAEGQRPSTTVDDVVLRLALTVDGQPGHAIDRELTAVALTLDVCGTRTSPTADPPVLPADKKIAPGRFLHVALPDLSHERALLLIRPPEPAAFTGNLVLTPVTTGVRAFTDEVPAAGQSPIATPLVLPPAAQRLFAEGTTESGLGGETGFFLGLAGIEPEGDRVTMTVGRLEVLDAAGAVTTFVPIGLWDHAFKPNGKPLDEEAEANNLAGADTRRFHFRLHDASRSGTGSIGIEWHVVKENGEEGRAKPQDRGVPLVEAPANSGSFVSRGLLLVTDLGDLTPFPQHGPLNHRLRLADVRSRVIGTYPHPGVTDVRVSRTIPVFRRTPESRRRLPLQVFVLRAKSGGEGVEPLGADNTIFNVDLRVVEETYARLGIEVQTVVAPGTPPADIRQERRTVKETVRLAGPQAFVLLRPPVVNDPRNTVTLTHDGTETHLVIVLGRAPNPGEVRLDLATGRLTLNQPPAVGDRLVATYVGVGHQVVLIDPPFGVEPTLLTDGDEAELGREFPALPHTIRVFYAHALKSDENDTHGKRGEAKTEARFGIFPEVASCFISAAKKSPYTVAHEIGHVLTNKVSATGNGHYTRPHDPPGNRLFENQNLMHDGTSADEGVDRTKRLWDATDNDGVNQFEVIRKSDFTRPF